MKVGRTVLADSPARADVIADAAGTPASGHLEGRGAVSGRGAEGGGAAGAQPSDRSGARGAHKAPEDGCSMTSAVGNDRVIDCDCVLC